MELLFTLILFCLTWFNYQFHKSIMAPAVLFSAIWAVSLGLHALFSITLLEGLFPLSTTVLLLFAGGAIAFSLGGLICVFFNKEQTIANKPLVELSLKYAPFSYLFRLVLLFICVLVLPFFIQRAIELFIKSQIDNFFVGLRWELTYGDEGLGALKYIVTFSTLVFAVCQAEALRIPLRRNKVLAFISFLLALVYALFFTGRVYFVMMFALYIGIQVIYNPKFRIKKFVWIAPAVVIVFTVFGLVYGKGGSFEESFASNLQSSSQNTALYFSGSLSALDWELNHNFEVAFNGHNSLRFFYVAAAAAGITGPIRFNDNLVQEFVFIPYETNVFTIYSPYVRDFGFLYPLMMLFFIGWLHSWLYKKVQEKGSPRYVIYYSILLYPLIMSFFQDQYFTLLSTWFQTYLIIETLLFLNKLFIRKIHLVTSI